MLNNEQVGISAEIAIADYFGVNVSLLYRSRAVNAISRSIRPIVGNIFESYNIPKPVQHIAEGQNDVDFRLNGGKTLSVKTNKQALGKAAPQRIGQASSTTWFEHLKDKLSLTQIPSSYLAKSVLFKQIALSRIDELLVIYWENMFDCDYLVDIYNVVDKYDNPTNKPKYVVFEKSCSPKWDKNKVTFTKSIVAEWNESTTVKYNGITIGEFQVHNNRDNFKFRFNMAGVAELMARHLI